MSSDRSCSSFRPPEQVEMDVYTLLKKWLFLRLFPDWLSDNPPPPETSSSSSSAVDHMSLWTKNLAAASELHLATLAAPPNASSSPKSLLNCGAGKPFARVFRCLRLQHIVNDLNSLDILEKVTKMGRLEFCHLP